MTHLTTPARCRAAILLSAVLSLVACAGDDTSTDSAPAATAAAASDATPMAAPAPGSSAPAAAGPASAAPASSAPAATTTAIAAGGDVAGAELVCPAGVETLALAKEAGWGPGAGRTDDAAKASISAQMVIALVLDDNGQTQALWDATDAIAAEGCPDDAARLAAVYGSSTILDILRAR